MNVENMRNHLANSFPDQMTWEVDKFDFDPGDLQKEFRFFGKMMARKYPGYPTCDIRYYDNIENNTIVGWAKVVKKPFDTKHMHIEIEAGKKKSEEIYQEHLARMRDFS